MTLGFFNLFNYARKIRSQTHLICISTFIEAIFNIFNELIDSSVEADTRVLGIKIIKLKVSKERKSFRYYLKRGYEHTCD